MQVHRPKGVIDGVNELRTHDWSFRDADTLGLTHGLHPYPAKFVPQIAEALIQALSKPGDTVADIFCGSGTVLVEAMRLGRHAIGIDANPLACLITEAKTSRLNEDDLSTLGDLARRARQFGTSINLYSGDSLFGAKGFTSDAWRPGQDVTDFWFEPFVTEELAEILRWCEELTPDRTRKFAATVFSSIVVQVSRQDSDTRYVRRNKNIAPGDTLLKFASAMNRAIKMGAGFAEVVDANVRCSVHHVDTLSKPAIGDADLIVCSPPYPNAYSYHLYHRTRMVWLRMDQPAFKQIEIGSHRKYSAKGPNGATENTFLREMSSVFSWLKGILPVGRYACFVIGNSIIRGKRIDNAQILRNTAESCGWTLTESIEREIMATRKAFNPKIGKIKSERIMVFENGV